MARREKRIWLLYGAGIFLYTFLFFAVLHPLTVFSADDWMYISYTRHAFPLLGAWNPAKVLPEIFMSLWGDLAAWVVYPLTGDYLGSMTVVFAAVVGLFTAAYVCMFGRLLMRRMGADMWQAALLSTVFFQFHFLVLRGAETGNLYLFHAPDLTCYLNYVIPNLFNCTLVLYFMADDAFDAGRGGKSFDIRLIAERPVKYGLLLLALYMAVFSNLYSSVILGVFVGWRFLSDCAVCMREKRAWREIFRRNVLRLGFLFSWAVQHLFEATGGRAGAVEGGQSLFARLGQTVRGLLDVGRTVNVPFLLLAAAVLAAAIALRMAGGRRRPVFRRGSRGALAGQSALCAVSVCLYVTALCSVHEPSYIQRPDLMFGAYFYAFLVLGLCAAYVLRRVPAGTAALPLLCCALVFEINTREKTFIDPHWSYYTTDTCRAISQDLVEQFVRADEAGQDRMQLLIPSGCQGWPLSDSAGKRIGYTLWEHGVVERLIEAEVVPSAEKDRQFGIAED